MHKSKPRVVAVFWALMAATAACAAGAAPPADLTAKAPSHHVYLIGSLRVTQPWIDVTGAPGQDAPAYLVVQNRGEAPDRLTGASVMGAASTAVVSAAGPVASEAAAVVVPAGATVLLEPGQAHLIVHGLGGITTTSPPVDGTLRFERAGSLSLSFMTDRAAAMAEDGPLPSEDKPVHLSQ